MRTKERWKLIAEVADGKRFEVSSRGRVRDIVTGKIQKLAKTKAGFLVVRSRWEDKRQSVTLHRLVAKAFLPGKPTFPVVFKYGKRTRCSVSNLEWAKGNSKIIRYRKLTDSDVRYIRAQWPSRTQSALAEELGVCRDTISAVVNYERFTGPKWMVTSPVDHRTSLEGK